MLVYLAITFSPFLLFSFLNKELQQLPYKLMQYQLAVRQDLYTNNL